MDQSARGGRSTSPGRIEAATFGNGYREALYSNQRFDLQFCSSLAHRLFMFGSVAGFPDSKREQLQMRLRLASSRPPKARWAELDKVLHELITLVLPDDSGAPPGTKR
jgi:hypothetical protein